MINEAPTVVETISSSMFTKQDLIVILIGLLGFLIIGCFAAAATLAKVCVSHHHYTDKKLINTTKSFSYAIDFAWLVWIILFILLVYGQAHGWISW